MGKEAVDYMEAMNAEVGILNEKLKRFRSGVTEAIEYCEGHHSPGSVVKAMLIELLDKIKS